MVYRFFSSPDKFHVQSAGTEAKPLSRYNGTHSVICGVARVPAPGDKDIFASPPIKSAEFEVKNRHNSVEEAKP